MDPLSAVVHSLRVSGTVLFRAELRSPWALAGPPAAELQRVVMPRLRGGPMVLFHVVQTGSCHLSVDGTHRRLYQGDVAVLAKGESHALSDEPGRHPIPVTEVLPPPGSPVPPVIAYGGKGNETQLLCGCFMLEGVLFEPLMAALPSTIVVSAKEGPSARWLGALLDGTLEEVEAGRAGSNSVLQRLAELFFVDVLRASMAELGDERIGWLAALQDESVGKALQLLHEDPAKRWTVTELAKRVGVSRSGLAAKFTRTLNEPPMRYLARWRIHLGADLLAREDRGVAETAARVGYESEAAFSRAFRRVFGQPPASWLRSTRAELPKTSAQDPG